jgi:type IV secretion system protein VirB10
MRLSRKVLIGLAALGAIAISAALIWGFYQRRNPVAGTELYNTENKTTPDGLSTLPRDYTGVPQNSAVPAGVRPLGPPLPGDLGRAMVNARSGRRRHSGRADHWHSLRPPRPGYRPGHRERL